MIKDYLDYIFNSTLAQNTINTYKAIILKYQVSDIDKTINKLNKTYHQPAYFRQNQAVLVSYYRFTKNYQAVEILKALRLPPLAMEYKAVFRREFLLDKTSIKADDNDKKIFAKNLIRFYFETGIRAHEINNVIRFSNETMTIKGKGGKIREIFYKLDTWDLIKDKIGNITYRKISAMTKRVLGKEYAPHSIRRSFATHMLLSGANPKMVMLQMGHTNINTTYRYLNISKEINKDIYNKYI